MKKNKNTSIQPSSASASTANKTKRIRMTCFSCKNGHTACRKSSPESEKCIRCAKMNIECIFPICTSCALAQLKNCNGRIPCSVCVNLGLSRQCAYAPTQKNHKRKRDTAFLHSRLSPELNGCKITAIQMREDWMNDMYAREFKYKYQLPAGTEWKHVVKEIVERDLQENIKNNKNEFTKAMAKQFLEQINLKTRVQKRRKKNEKFDFTSMLLIQDIKRLQQGLDTTGTLMAKQSWLKNGLGKVSSEQNKKITFDQLNELHQLVSAQEENIFSKQCKFSKTLVLGCINMIQSIYL